MVGSLLAARGLQRALAGLLCLAFVSLAVLLPVTTATAAPPEFVSSPYAECGGSDHPDLAVYCENHTDGMLYVWLYPRPGSDLDGPYATLCQIPSTAYSAGTGYPGQNGTDWWGTSRHLHADKDATGYEFRRPVSAEVYQIPIKFGPDGVGCVGEPTHTVTVVGTAAEGWEPPNPGYEPGPDGWSGSVKCGWSNTPLFVIDPTTCLQQVGDDRATRGAGGAPLPEGGVLMHRTAGAAEAQVFTLAGRDGSGPWGNAIPHDKEQVKIYDILQGDPLTKVGSFWIPKSGVDFDRPADTPINQAPRFGDWVTIKWTKDVDTPLYQIAIAHVECAAAFRTALDPVRGYGIQMANGYCDTPSWFTAWGEGHNYEIKAEGLDPSPVPCGYGWNGRFGSHPDDTWNRRVVSLTDFEAYNEPQGRCQVSVFTLTNKDTAPDVVLTTTEPLPLPDPPTESQPHPEDPNTDGDNDPTTNPPPNPNNPPPPVVTPPPPPTGDGGGGCDSFSFTDPTTWAGAGICVLVKLIGTLTDLVGSLLGTLVGLVRDLIDAVVGLVDAVVDGIADMLAAIFVPSKDSIREVRDSFSLDGTRAGDWMDTFQDGFDSLELGGPTTSGAQSRTASFAATSEAAASGGTLEAMLAANAGRSGCAGPVVASPHLERVGLPHQWEPLNACEGDMRTMAKWCHLLLTLSLCLFGTLKCLGIILESLGFVNQTRIMLDNDWGGATVYGKDYPD